MNQYLVCSKCSTRLAKKGVMAVRDEEEDESETYERQGGRCYGCGKEFDIDDLSAVQAVLAGGYKGPAPVRY